MLLIQNLRTSKMVKYITYQSSNYEVGSDGSVRNISTGRILKSYDSSAGYLKVCLHIKGKQITKTVHRLVAETHHASTRQPDFEVDHINRDKNNNSSSNLRWVSKKTNAANRGKRAKQSKLLTISEYKEFIGKYLEGALSIAKITVWANLQFGRTSSVRAYTYILSGTSCKKFWNALTKVERDSVLQITAARTN